MADGAGLAGDAAAGDAAFDVELIRGAGQVQRLTDNQLEGVQAEIIVDIAAVDLHAAGPLVQADAGNGFLSSAGAVKIRSLIVIHRGCLLP